MRLRWPPSVFGLGPPPLGDGPTAGAEVVGWLSPETLLVVVPLADRAADVRAVLVEGDRSIALPVMAVALAACPDVSVAGATPVLALIGGFAVRHARPEPGRELVVDVGRVRHRVAFIAVKPELLDLKHLAARVRNYPLANRLALMEALAAAMADLRGTDAARRLGARLAAVRDQLRGPLPVASNMPTRPLALGIENLIAVAEDAFYLSGWHLDRYAPVERLTAVSPEGVRVELLSRAIALPRPDIADAGDPKWRAAGGEVSGFACYFSLGSPSYEPFGWLVELADRSGRAVQAVAPPVIREPVAARDAILFGLPLEALPHERLMAEHVAPALRRLQQQEESQPAVASLVSYGPPPPNPVVSIVVPLYRRIDFVEQQLAQFAHDPELAASDLIYVLDSPEMANELRDVADQLQHVYPTPFRVVTLASNSGYAAANNVGAGLARGRLLLLLNSDVLPDRPGWLSAMQRFHDATPGIGALGPKLLYADESIQHAGMYFDRPAGTALAGSWQNVHYFKGLRRDLPAATINRPVPAVTGACLMIDRAVYRRIGGFQQTYVQGDYEDSDLCLRLERDGLACWYLADVELYHLEGQSYPSELRGRMALYNRWLQTRLWDDAIERLMAHDWSMMTVPTESVRPGAEPSMSRSGL